MASSPRPRLGISACLLGRPVRYDGGHKRDDVLLGELGRFVEWFPVCPEVESGLPTPRETLQLIRVGDDVRMMATRTDYDHSPAMREWAAHRLDDLAGADLSGFVLKKNSPSCGLEGVEIFGAGAMPVSSGTGLFAAALVRRFPLLPVDDEGRLQDPLVRENFIERVFAYGRMTTFFRGQWTPGQLVAFHTAHKLTLLAHEPAAYRALGQLVARAGGLPPTEVRETYSGGFMSAFRAIATRGRHTNVLQHIAGYFRTVLDERSRRELNDLIDRYAAGDVPLAIPLTLLRRHIEEHGVAYLAGQTYLDAAPAALRNPV